MATPQENLDLAYPLAVDGDAVFDEESGDYWLKDNGEWTNVGPVLGETINIDYDIVPYRETVLTEKTVRIGIKFKSYPYSFVNQITEAEPGVALSLDFGISTFITLEEPFEIQVQAPVPAVNFGGVFVLPGTVPLAVVQFPPSEIISSLVPPGASIAITAFVPGTQANVLVNTSRAILVIHPEPAIETVPSPQAVTVAIAAFEPISIGGFIEIPVTVIKVSPLLPSFESDIPVSTITIFRGIPSIQTAVIIPAPRQVEIRANLPDDGSGIIIESSIITLNAFAPVVDAYPVVDMSLMWGEVVVTYNQPPDIFGGPVENGFTAATVPVVGIFDYNELEGINSDTANPWNGEKSTVQKKFGQFSGRFYRTDQGATPTATNSVILQLADPLIDRPSYPWFETSGITPEVFQLYTPGTNYRNNRNLCVELWVFPLSESFTGTTEGASTPLISDVFDQDATTIYRLWDLLFRGQSGTGTVIARFNDQNITANPLAVVVEVQSNTNAFVANQWQHVVLMRLNDQIGIAVNGVWGPLVDYAGQFASISQEESIQTGIFSGLSFTTKYLGRFRLGGRSGSYAGDANRFSGYMDQIRWMKGRTPYTFSNFTPPTEPFPASIHKKVERDLAYYPVTSFYDQNMWKWWWTVETSYDLATLEEGVKLAVNRFILGCKRDEIWYSFTDCFLFVGPNSLNGVLKIALYGANPDDYYTEVSGSTGFLTSDYNRETGLKGDGVSKSIRTSRVNNTFPMSNHHRAAWVTEVGTGPIFAGGVSQVGSTYVDWIPGYGGIRHGFNTNIRATSGEDAISSSGGFVGFSRNNKDFYEFIVPGESGIVNEPAQTPWLEPVEILGASIDQANNYQTISRGSHRLAFYSHGASLDLNKLKRRVEILINEIQQAIP